MSIYETSMEAVFSKGCITEKLGAFHWLIDALNDYTSSGGFLRQLTGNIKKSASGCLLLLMSGEELVLEHSVDSADQAVLETLLHALSIREAKEVPADGTLSLRKNLTPPRTRTIREEIVSAVRTASSDELFLIARSLSDELPGSDPFRMCAKCRERFPECSCAAGKCKEYFQSLVEEEEKRVPSFYA